MQEPHHLELLSTGIAETLINAMEAKNPYLRGHSQRVAELAASTAEAMGLPADTVEQVRLAGRLHDVGKIGIREEILDKPGASRTSMPTSRTTCASGSRSSRR